MREFIPWGGFRSPLRDLLMLKAASGGGLTEYTVTGNPVSFETNVAKDLTECKVGFSPVQAGSGDPSPSNVRPITGWTGLNVWRGVQCYRCIPTQSYSVGQIIETKNGISVQYLGFGKYRIFGTASANTTTTGISINPFTTLPTTNTNRKIKINNESLDANVYFVFANGSDYYYLGTANRYGGYTALANKTITSIYFYVASGRTVDGTLQPEFIDETNMSTYPVTWTEAGTVYGGTVDLVSGVMTADWIAYDLTLNDWTSGGGGIFYQDFDPNWAAGDLTALCSNYKTRYGNSNPVNGELLYWPRGVGRLPRILIYDTSKSSLSVDEFKNAMSGVQLIYKINNPTTYQLTPQQIKTLIGTNNIWSDANGENTIKYLKKG